MIGKIQSCIPFKGVYIKRNGQAAQNINRSYNDLSSQLKDNEPFGWTGFDQTSYNFILKYGMDRLNDKTIDDGQKRYLSFNPVYDFDDKHIGYDICVLDENGDTFAGASSVSVSNIMSLKNAFDKLVDAYKEKIQPYMMVHYGNNCSSPDKAISSYLVDDGPDNA